MSADAYEIDAVVIGAGVIGLACAAALARRGVSVQVLEREGRIGSGVSARNSEVIHAGLYYPTGGRKHLLCIEGRRRLYAYAATRGVAHAKVGKLIVARDAAEAKALEPLYLRALRNGVEHLQFLTGAQARRLEPNLSAHAAIFSPETGIVDSHGLMLALQGELEAAGGAVALNAAATSAAIDADGRYIIEAGGARLTARILINAAGLNAPSFAHALDGYDAGLIPTLHLAKGSYFTCAGKPAFSRLIYPAPVDGGLGVHLTLDLAGRMRFGPDVEWLATRDPQSVDYAVDAKRADAFYDAIRRYWPALPDGALAPDYSGCRPKLSGPGEAAADFRIDGPDVHGHSGLVHLFGMESPGLTSSLAAAEAVADLALGVAPAPAPEKRAAVFFDRDGTLNHDGGYTHKPDDLRWIDGAIEAVRAANARGMLAVVVTNQSGLARGYYDEAAMHAFHARMQAELAHAGATIDAFYFCPYLANAATPAYDYADHPDRKPNPGMALRAAADLDIDLRRSILIGDTSADMDAAAAAGVKGVHYSGGNVAHTLTAALSAL
ncbi:MAG: FAD-dependent oxidoreductase [Alphaproteobacteria bacterium]|nr:FAD-dependent oxidoreductase [Alphaproteobacteria bacterium]